MLQRVFLAATGIAFLAAAIHHPASRVGAGIYAGAIALVAATGAAVAGTARLAPVPAARTSARPAGLPWTTCCRLSGRSNRCGRVLRGSGECGVVDWTFLSFSIPEWTLAAFLAFHRVGGVLALRD